MRARAQSVKDRGRHNYRIAKAKIPGVSRRCDLGTIIALVKSMIQRNKSGNTPHTDNRVQDAFKKATTLDNMMRILVSNGK